MPIKVFNNLTKKIEEFHPLGEREREIQMYVCGVTPYDYSHLGHARTYAAFDVIKRYFEYRGYKVRYIQNITDIDDKIIKRANEVGADPLKLSLEFQKSALEDMDALKIARADKYPKVTEHIPEIIALIKKLISRGYAYETEDGVYFEVEKFPDYGKLSKQSLDEIKAGARVEIDEKKRNPADFALWKKAKPGEPFFESPWGKGRPGWHIECSAMSMKYLGDNFDIHGGGRDLIFPHHENEIAQSEGATGKQFVKYWLHTGFLSVNKEKMAKSLGNFITIKDALKKHDADSLRLFYALTHYRSPIDFSDKNVEYAHNALEGLRNTLTNARNALANADEKNHEKTINT
ncbi:MAG: cysteine--tRNA ligase, partial [Candidatus Micrarchaeota archaeon]